MSEAAPASGTRATTALPIIDVLTSVPIQGALFTTYTLSLAWFETYLLRGLERAGARQILLLADPFGVHSSLGEGLVTGPGVRYTVEPVEAPHGAFHAKIAVLWSDSALMVAVGSGNLTFSGMHRNLEAWEVLTAGVQAAGERQLTRPVAESARAFVAHLQSQVDPGSRAATTLAAAAASIDAWLPRLPSRPVSVWWIDSTREPVGDQLVRRLGSRDGRRLQVLSPFHDSDGSALRRLANGFGANLEILYTGDKTTYPLAAKDGVSSRRITGVDEGRPLHAKVFHVIDGDGAHLVSGSANATTKALWTTGNTEVSLLRKGAFEVLLASEPGTPHVDVTHVNEPEPQPLAIRWARAGNDHVRARVRWTGAGRPREGLIGFVDSLEAPVRIDWPLDDIVQARLPATFNPLRPRAQRLELVVVCDGARWSARAWVAFDELLNASPEFRAALYAWSRILQGEDGPEGDDDDAVLLRAFAEEHVQTMAAVGAGHLAHARGPHAQTPVGHGDVSIPLRLLDALAHAPMTGPMRGVGGTPGTIAEAEQAMRAAFAEPDGSDGAAEDEGDDADGRGARAPRGSGRLHQSTRRALDHFELAFLDACNGIVKMPASPGSVLAYTSLCVRLAIRYRLKDGNDRSPFWESVEKLVRALLCPLSRRAPLVSLLHKPGASLAGEWAELLALLIALLSWRHDGGLLEKEQYGSPPELSKDVVRESLAVLDRAAGVRPSPCALPRALADVFPASRSSLADRLAMLREAPSASEKIITIKAQLEAVMRGDAPPTTVDLERGLASEALRAGPRFVAPWIDVCPHCHRALPAALRNKMLRRQAALCLNMRCNCLLVPSEGA